MSDNDKNIDNEATNKDNAIFAILMIIIVISFIVIIIKMMGMIKSSKFQLNLSMLNQLSNTISLGSNIGDFVACVFNGYGDYENVNSSIVIDAFILYDAWNTWAANNNYNMTSETNFNNAEYNTTNKLSALPKYLVEKWTPENKDMFGYVVAKNNNDLSWNDYDKYYENRNVKCELKITKISSSYLRMSIFDRDWKDIKNEFCKTTIGKLIYVYKCDKTLEEVLNNLDLLNNNFKSGFNYQDIYDQYCFFIVSTKYEKKLKSPLELKEMLMTYYFVISGKYIIFDVNDNKFKTYTGNKNDDNLI